MSDDLKEEVLVEPLNDEGIENTSHNMDVFFETQIKEHGTSLFQYIYSLVKHKELAEDLQQEVLIAAYKSLSNFEERAKFRSWLYKIALNKCRDYWRKEKTAKKFWEEKVYVNTIETMEVILPEKVVMEKCTKEEIVNMLKELPEIYRDPLLLFYFHNHSILEISHKINLPISTVKTRMKRAKERLRPVVDYYENEKKALSE